MQQESIEFHAGTGTNFDLEFSENGTAADSFTEAPVYNPVLPLVLKLS